MKKLLLLLVLITGTFSAQAQIIDSLPWFKLERITLQLAERIGDISDGQLQRMQQSVSPILQRASNQQMTKQLRTRLRQEVRKAIVGELTAEQKSRLKATRKGEQDALDQAMTGKSQGLRKRQ